MLRIKGISGFGPARLAPGKPPSGLILILVLAIALPTAGQVEDEGSDSGEVKVEDNRNLPAVEDIRNLPAKEVRPALARRKRNALSQFDPKVFEARGRELQGEYYEITTIAKGNSSWSAPPTDASVATQVDMGTTAPKTSSSKNWMIWSGAAGLAALVGGAAGYLMFEKHTAPEPVTVHLDDDPQKP